MRVLYLLLLALGLFSQLATGVNLLTGFGQRSDHYICVKKGGTCNFSSCPLFQRIEGTCYGRKAKCCIRLW
uniref:Beta-defensin 1 n=2 Tax=Monodontidae TaxID=9747 RepID=A0A8C6AWZ5_MONMO